MIQTITVPEKTIEHIVSEIHMNIVNPANVTGRVIIGKRPAGDTSRPPFFPYGVNITNILTDEVTAGNLTGAEIQAFKKCIKAICAKGLDISFADTNDPL